MDKGNRFLLHLGMVASGVLALLACFTIYHLDEAYWSCRQAEIRDAGTDRIQLARLRAEKAAFASILAKCAETSWRDGQNIRTVK